MQRKPITIQERKMAFQAVPSAGYISSTELLSTIRKKYDADMNHIRLSWVLIGLKKKGLLVGKKSAGYRRAAPLDVSLEEIFKKRKRRKTQVRDWFMDDLPLQTPAKTVPTETVRMTEASPANKYKIVISGPGGSQSFDCNEFNLSVGTVNFQGA